MDKIRLNNGVELPLIGFGTYPMHGAECEDSVITAIQAGYRMLDTAEAYGNEEEVGRGIARCGIPREELTLVTKVDFKSYDHALLSVENSLKKLGTDYLDLVLLHWPFANYYAAWRTLEDLYRQGKIRAIGGNPSFLPAEGEPQVDGKIRSGPHGLRAPEPGTAGGHFRRSRGGYCRNPRQDGGTGAAALPDSGGRYGHPQVQPSGAHPGEF